MTLKSNDQRNGLRCLVEKNWSRQNNIQAVTWSLLTSFNGFYQDREREVGRKRGQKGGRGDHKYINILQRKSRSIVKVADRVDLVGIILKKLEILRENRVLCPRTTGKLSLE